jgi:DTW domain-containing protein YfiP
MQSERAQHAWDSARVDLERHRANGLKGPALFEAVASDSLHRKCDGNPNRCPRCWHDRRTSCICSQLEPLTLTLPVKILVLMHYREFLSAGDDAKLLLALLPPDQVKNYVFGQRNALEQLREELAVNPENTLILWPGKGACTVEEWRASRAAAGAADAAESGARAEEAYDDPGASVSSRRLLRVVVLDGVYTHARLMFRTLTAALAADGVRIAHVALHPRSLSLYHRAQKRYSTASSATISASVSTIDDPLAMRICTLEAVALLLEEVGEPQRTTEVLLRALVTNNRALQPAVRPQLPQPPQRPPQPPLQSRAASSTTSGRDLLLKLDIRLVRSDQHTSGMSTCNVSTSSVSSCSTFRRSAHAHAVEVSLVVLHQPPDSFRRSTVPTHC